MATVEKMKRDIVVPFEDSLEQWTTITWCPTLEVNAITVPKIAIDNS